MYQVKVKVIDDIGPKTSEVQAAVNAYISAQAYQLEHGGPGPVAGYEIMAIVNEHNGQFEVILNEEV